MYKQQKFLSCGFEDGKSKMKAPADFLSGEDLFLIGGTFYVSSPGRRNILYILPQASFYKGTDPICECRFPIAGSPSTGPTSLSPRGLSSNMSLGDTNIQGVEVYH
jgi:hypothetical protein